jgi:oxalate---CoA ligase
MSLSESNPLPLLHATLQDIVATRAAQLGESPAILAPGRLPLSFARLHQHITDTRSRLWKLGIGRGDIVINVLPSGSDAAVASLCIASCATVAVLNPDLLELEYASLFEKLTPKLVIAYPGQAQAARAAAQRINVPVVEVLSQKEAGVFTIASDARPRGSIASGPPAEAGDIAYILTTSGSTALPKLVPLRHTLLATSISDCSHAFSLTATDRCLNFSPQFHSLGFNGGFLVPLASGGSVACTPRFQASDFFTWLDEFQPTWFFAVPTILQEILAHALRYEGVVKRASIRFLATSGAPLPPTIAEQVESLFRAPLMQVYGLSEAQNIAMDRFCVERRPGSCGRPRCNEVITVNANGTRVTAGEAGEIIVRGPAVIDAYFRDPELSQAALRDGWFHTRDIAYFDSDGYLFLTGRASDFINRAGEKISPLEVDRVLITHPAVAEAVTFSMPHEKFGEEIAAAVVLRPRSLVTEGQLQHFAAERLAVHKLPRRIFFLDQLPLGPTGKIKRSAVWEHICQLKRAPSEQAGGQVEPRDERERCIAALFARILGKDRIGIHDNFFDVGGDSIAATQCALLVEKELGLPSLSPAVFLWAPTVAQLAELLSDPMQLTRTTRVLPFQPEGDGIPLFLIHPGHEGPRIARHLGTGHPLFGVPIPPPMSAPQPRSITEMAIECTRVIQRFRPHGPYALAGWCAAGIVALEMAHQLERQGSDVAFVAMLDAQNFFLPPLSPPHRAWVRFWQGLRRYLYATRRYPRTSWARIQNARAARAAPQIPETTQALTRHRPHPFGGRMVHIWASECPRGGYFDPGFGWNHLAPNGFVFHRVLGNHLTMIQEPIVAGVARIFASELDRAQTAYLSRHASPQKSWIGEWRL